MWKGSTQYESQDDLTRT